MQQRDAREAGDPRGDGGQHQRLPQRPQGSAVGAGGAAPSVLDVVPEGAFLSRRLFHFVVCLVLLNPDVLVLLNPAEFADDC